MQENRHKSKQNRTPTISKRIHTLCDVLAYGLGEVWRALNEHDTVSISVVVDSGDSTHTDDKLMPGKIWAVW